ncbi:MAG TPA: phosphatase PAP2 family protein [Nocardioidaceae bacterium]|nr:phosphatase PAP2 family protein [Nocardioidaceae bacterium]
MSGTAGPQLSPRTPPPAPSRRGRAAGWAVLVALASAAGVAVIAYLALYTARGQELDDRAMRIFSDNGDPTAARPLLELLSEVSIGSAGLALAVFVCLALLRRGFTLAVAAVAVTVGANLTTQVLKHLVLTRPDLGHGTLNSLPSGHTTLVFSLVLAALLVAPVVLRVPVTVLGAAVGTLTGAATVVAGWHRPSDVVTATLVTLAWGGAAIAVLDVLSPGTARPPVRPFLHRAGAAFGLAAVLGTLVAGLMLVVWGVGPGSGPGEMVAAVLSLGSIALFSALVVGGYGLLVGHTVG